MGKGLQAVVESDLIQLIVQNYESIIIPNTMLRMAHCLMEKLEVATKLPMNSLQEFVSAMNCD